VTEVSHFPHSALSSRPVSAVFACSYVHWRRLCLLEILRVPSSAIAALSSCIEFN
jgi:hypothetical protein